MLFTGLKNSLIVGFLVGGVSTTIAVFVAFFAAYKGGIIDNFLNSLTNIILILPAWAIAAAAVAYIQRLDLLYIALVISAFAWAGPAMSIRAQVLSLKSRPYVELAKMIGERDIVGPVLVLVCIFVSLNLINMGLDELFNPRLRRVTGE
jgi:peptide/nickel transport system permease protein